MSNKNRELYKFGNFCLDVDERRLFRIDDEPTAGSLREKAFEVLLHLVRNQGRLIHKEELLSVAWPDTLVEEGNLSKTVHAIRGFLAQAPGEQRYIETVPKHGYRFVANVERIGRATGIAIAVDPIGSDLCTLPAAETGPSAAPHGVAAPRRISRALLLGAAVLIFMSLAAALFLARPWQTAEQSPPRGAANSPADPARAYDLYIRGKVKAGAENRDENEAAIKLLEEAVQFDPSLVGAYVQLARAYNTKAFKFSSQTEQKNAFENAEVAVEKALRLNPDLAEAHFARGLILWSFPKGFPHELAIQSYRRALELDRTQDEAHHQLSVVYAHIGLLDKAQDSLQKALEINPNNTMARFRVGNYFIWQGKRAEGLAVLKSIPTDISPLLVDRIRAEALIQNGNLEEAQEIVDSYLIGNPKDEGGSLTSVKALLLAKAGNRQAAEDAIVRCSEIGRGFGHFHHTEYNIAAAYAALNEPALAVKWLRAAADDGFPCYTCMKVDPNLINLRQDKSFNELVSSLEQEWSKLGLQ